MIGVTGALDENGAIRITLRETIIRRCSVRRSPARDGHARSRPSASAKARPYCYHMAMARTQTLVQLSDELLERLDAYRAREGRSRSEVVREAIEQYLAADREAEIDRLIVEAYTRRPPEDVWGDEPAKRMIAAEPW
jgi:predicted DNA-binding protein